MAAKKVLKLLVKKAGGGKRVKYFKTQKSYNKWLKEGKGKKVGGSKGTPDKSVKVMGDKEPVFFGQKIPKRFLKPYNVQEERDWAKKKIIQFTKQEVSFKKKLEKAKRKLKKADQKGLQAPWDDARIEISGLKMEIENAQRAVKAQKRNLEKLNKIKTKTVQNF